MVDRRRERVVQVEACGIACRIDGAKSTAPNRENTTASPGEVEVNPQPVTSNAIIPVRKSKCVMGTPRVTMLASTLVLQCANTIDRRTAAPCRATSAQRLLSRNVAPTDSTSAKSRRTWLEAYSKLNDLHGCATRWRFRLASPAAPADP